MPPPTLNSEEPDNRGVGVSLWIHDARRTAGYAGP